MLKRTDWFALLALSRHPRDRALEILRQGGWPRVPHRLVRRPTGAPDDADPNEYIVLMRLPSTAVFPGGTDS
jgi:hypothetical protein